MITTDDIFQIADDEYRILRNSNQFVGGLLFGEIELPVETIADTVLQSAIAIINHGRVKEIQLNYVCGVVETIRAGV